MSSTYFPEEFRAKYEKLLGNDAAEFFKFSQKKIRKSLWINSLKIPPKELLSKLEEKNWKLQPLQFHGNAFVIENIQKPGFSYEFKHGLLNLQEISSMLPAIVLQPLQNELVLDCTAAPGNKTLQMSCLMQGKGRIYAIESYQNRFKTLLYNVRKFWMKNVQAVKGDFLKLKTDKRFDKILLDAPCSTEGIVRKEFFGLKGWSPKLVKRKAKIQKRMVEKAFQLLKPNGILVYSTCSLSPEEDEEVVQNLLEENKNLSIEKIELPGIKLRKGLKSYEGKNFSPAIGNCARILPQDNDTQAFFMAKIRRLE